MIAVLGHVIEVARSRLQLRGSRAHRDAAATNMGMGFQNFGLQPYLSVLEATLPIPCEFRA